MTVPHDVRRVESGRGDDVRRAFRLHQKGRLEDADRLYREAIASDPHDANALHLFGVLKGQRADFEAAAELIGRSIALEPRNPMAFYNRGNILRELKRLDEALVSFDQTLAMMPAHVEAWTNRGTVLQELGRSAEALASFDHALALAPLHVTAWFNRANALRHLKRQDEALQSYDRVLALKPDHAEAHDGRGVLLQELRRYPEAFAAYDAAYRLDPALKYVQGRRLHVKMTMCDWSNLNAERAQLAVLAEAGGAASEPFEFLCLSSSAEAQLRCARAFADDRYPVRNVWSGAPRAHRKIRLGYVSGEFREQATAFLMAGVYECHDRERFELHAIATGPNDSSPMRARLEQAFDRFHNVSEETDRGIADLIRAEEIDILINLNGYFGLERTAVFALKPAPIQVNYLGFPGTMGADFMDYVVADEIILPRDQQRHFAEKVAYLPYTYQPNDRKRAIAERTPTRAECGLPESGVVFCCFNNTHKLTPEFFDIWMRLLDRTPGSALWVLEPTPTVVQNLRSEAARRGIAPERIVFAPVIKLADHLARIRLADLFLDTLPHNAHTTASDALWCGAPVVTCSGQTFAGRVAASLLHAVGLEDLVTHTLETYEALALRLANHPNELAAVKARLASRRDTAPLFDTAGYTRHLESAYLAMWEKHLKGEPPASFTIEAQQ
jgi:predicted O-linked N-acetylglucosamine transferase (SPINDLY family)